MPEPARLRLAAVGLLGAPPRPGPVHRPQPEGHGRRQGGAGDRRLVGHRPGRGAQVRRGRRDHDHLRRATRTSWTRPCKEAQAPRATQFIAYPADIADMADCDRFVKLLLDEHGGVDFLINNAGRSIRRAIESQLRPLPRLRAHDAAQLLRLPARDDGPAARHGGQAQGPRRQHQLDRRADQRAALLGLRGEQGRARCVDALRVERVRRPGHHASRRSTCRWCARR